MRGGVSRILTPLHLQKSHLEGQLLLKQNPKQTAEIATLQKQLTVQRERLSKLKSSKIPANELAPPSRDQQSRITLLEKELEAVKRDSTAAKPPSTAIDAWLDNKKWNKKVSLRG